MSSSFEAFLRSHLSLMPETSAAGASERVFPIQLPVFPDGRQFQAARLILPGKFPHDIARIRLSKDAILRIPHVEHNGNLCFNGDSGPGSGISPEARITEMLVRFRQDFLEPWLYGELDRDFETESRNYWNIYVHRAASTHDPITKIYTVDWRQSHSRVYWGELFLPSRILIAGENQALASRFASSLGSRARQLINVLVADIPIDQDFTPWTWPESEADVKQLLACRLSKTQANMFQQARRGSNIHRVVILRGPNCSYGFVLSGGPPTVVEKGRVKRAYPTSKMLPLLVDRMDPDWTCGRDQHAAITSRQSQHVLILGAGALGSPVIDQLARAGIGRMTIVDPDCISSSNIGRHLLGAESLSQNKALETGRRVAQSNPSCLISVSEQTAQTWLGKWGLEEVDVILDLTGEPEVRSTLEQFRRLVPTALLVGWMEPYVAAAHVCLLPSDAAWSTGATDPLEATQAISWPQDVIQREPGCSSEFQSYTPAAATHAVALVAEGALALIDNDLNTPVVRSWVRGQNFLDRHYPGLTHREWARVAAPYDGLILERVWHG